MKTLLLAFFSMATIALSAQDVDYKKGMIVVDGSDYAKVEVKKTNFGLTKTFEVFNLAGEKIIIAVPATEFEQDKSDNSILFYRITFLTGDQVGIFKLNALSQEKSFAKLIGQSGILVKDAVDTKKLKEFIAAKSASPRIAVDYTLVNRNTIWPLRLQTDKTIEQDGKTIGSFKNLGTLNEQDIYEVLLPSGVVIAKFSFTGGNNAQNFELFTAKDNLKRVIPIPTRDKVLAATTEADKNQIALKRMILWMVENKYL